MVKEFRYDLIDTSYVQAGHFDTALSAMYPKAKKILVVGRKIE